MPFFFCRQEVQAAFPRCPLRGTDRGIRVHRKDDSGKVQEIKPAMDESLRNGDVIFVRESLF